MNPPRLNDPSLSALLSEISDRGWLVNNLFQRNPAVWQANLRSSTHHTEFALAATPSEALALCIDLIETAIESEPEPAIVVCEVPSGKGSGLSSILSRLRPRIERRI